MHKECIVRPLHSRVCSCSSSLKPIACVNQRHSQAKFPLAILFAYKAKLLRTRPARSISPSPASTYPHNKLQIFHACGSAGNAATWWAFFTIAKLSSQWKWHKVPPALPFTAHTGVCNAVRWATVAWQALGTWCCIQSAMAFIFDKHGAHPRFGKHGTSQIVQQKA